MLNPVLVPTAYEVLVDRHRHKGITYVAAGDTERNLDLLARRFVHGLVSGLPYEMGSFAVQLMMQVLKENEPIGPKVYGTNVVTHIQIPIVLPELTVDQNRVGNLAILGYIFFAIVALLGWGFGCWVWYCRRTRVVRASQPIFLLMLLLLWWTQCVISAIHKRFKTADVTTAVINQETHATLC